jgi:hypothetical protein
VLGAVMSLYWAPETARKSLRETADRSTPNFSRRTAPAGAAG